MEDQRGGLQLVQTSRAGDAGGRAARPASNGLTRSCSTTLRPANNCDAANADAAAVGQRVPEGQDEFAAFQAPYGGTG